MATLFLIRHCEPEMTGVFLGQLDSPLSATGKAHAAAAFAELEVDVVYTSPLLRALQTAERISSARLTVMPELREIHQGEWTGKSWSEIESNWPELARRKSANWLGVVPPGGETWPEVLSRAEFVWTGIRAGTSPVAVVAHQGINSAFASIICGANPLAFRQKYGEVIRLEHD